MLLTSLNLVKYNFFFFFYVIWFVDFVFLILIIFWYHFFCSNWALAVFRSKYPRGHAAQVRQMPRELHCWTLKVFSVSVCADQFFFFFFSPPLGRKFFFFFSNGCWPLNVLYSIFLFENRIRLATGTGTGTGRHGQILRARVASTARHSRSFPSLCSHFFYFFIVFILYIYISYPNKSRPWFHGSFRLLNKYSFFLRGRQQQPTAASLQNSKNTRQSCHPETDSEILNKIRVNQKRKKSWQIKVKVKE